jgi:hypothetical protein
MTPFYSIPVSRIALSFIVSSKPDVVPIPLSVTDGLFPGEEESIGEKKVHIRHLSPIERNRKITPYPGWGGR